MKQPYIFNFFLNQSFPLISWHTLILFPRGSKSISASHSSVFNLVLTGFPHTNEECNYMTLVFLLMQLVPICSKAPFKHHLICFKLLLKGQIQQQKLSPLMPTPLTLHLRECSEVTPDFQPRSSGLACTRKLGQFSLNLPVHQFGKSCAKQFIII